MALEARPIRETVARPVNQPPYLPPSLPSNQPPEPAWKKLLAPLAVVGLLLAKFKGLLLPVLKFLPVILKTGGTMLLSIGAYAMIWGWKYAVGFVLLIFVHECGHVVAARHFGLKASAPMFIPFMGAFIALRDAPRNAWIEAWIGISGPIAGALGALACHTAGELLGMPLLIAIAWSAYWLNLFNLIPVGQLDGGHVATALSPWMWVPGFGVLGWLAFARPSFIIWMLLALSLPRLFSLFRKRTPEEERFYEISPAQRRTMALLYFGLAGGLAFYMHVADTELHHVRATSPQFADAR
jgi:Zn-dependent protease